MEKRLPFGLYQITVKWSVGFSVQIYNPETKELWESEPHLNITEAIDQTDKSLLWYYEAYESRNSAKRKSLKKELEHLLERMSHTGRTE